MVSNYESVNSQNKWYLVWREYEKFRSQSIFRIDNKAYSANLYRKVLKKMNLNDKKPHQVARDESFWREIQQGYTADRGMVNLNNGGVSPSPSVVQNAMKS